MQVKLTITLAAFIAAGCLAFGGVKAYEQHRALWQFRSTSAKVIAWQRQPQSAGRGDRFLPAITYEYRRNGKTYESSRITPLPFFGSERWARQVLDDNRDRATISAFVDRDDPSRAFLIRRVAFWPYLVMLVPAAVLWVVLRPLYKGGFFHHAPACSRQTAGGWYYVNANRNAPAAAFNATIAAVLWYGYAATVLGHYIAVGRTTPDWLRPGPVIAALVIAAMGLVPVLYTLRAMRFAGRFQPAQVCITLSDLSLDLPLLARVQLAATHRTAVRKVSAILCCYQRNGLGSEELFATTQVLAKDVMIDRLHPVLGDCRFEIPPRKRRASSRYDRWNYPRVDWQIELEVVPQHGPTYRVSYPLRTHTQSEAAKPRKTAATGRTSAARTATRSRPAAA